MKTVIGVLIGIVIVVAIILGITQSGNKNNNSNNNKNASVYKYSGTLTGAGSTFAAPLYGQSGSDYKNASGSTVNYQAVGSGAGITQFIARTVNFGATDVALKDSEVAQAKAFGAPLNIPIAFGSVTVSYNVPGVKSGLKLDGQTLGNIYLGTVTNWNDPAIAALNPGVKLPNLPISPVYRSDSSGTTADFTEFLAATNSQWSQQVGSGKTVQWPTGTGAKGNTDVAATVTQTKGSIGYVELAYALKNNFTMAAVKNAGGDYITPTLDTTSKAGANLPNLPSDLRFSAINSPSKGAYPIASATFIVVYQDACKSGEVANISQAKALKSWLNYLLGNNGQQTMRQLQYAPLPTSLTEKAQAMVGTMTCNGSAI